MIRVTVGENSSSAFFDRLGNGRQVLKRMEPSLTWKTNGRAGLERQRRAGNHFGLQPGPTGGGQLAIEQVLFVAGS